MSQGTTSNSNGKLLESQVEEILKNLGIEYETQVRKYRAFGPKPQIHDFVLRDPTTVIECKYFSGSPGSIWEKIPYGMDMLRKYQQQYGVKSLMVFGGEFPTDWRFGYLLGKAEEFGIGFSVVDDLEEYLGSNRRKSDE